MRLIDADAFIKWLFENSITERELSESKQIANWVDVQPTVEPPSRYVAKIEINKEDIEGLVAEKVEEIKERILQAGMKGKEVELRIGGRLFRIREVAQ